MYEQLCFTFKIQIYFNFYRQKISQRTEPISKINEHALAQVGSGESTSDAKKVLMEDLLQAIAEKPRLRALPTAVKQVKKRGKTLQTPLEKPQALRVFKKKKFLLWQTKIHVEYF